MRELGALRKIKEVNKSKAMKAGIHIVDCEAFRYEYNILTDFNFSPTSCYLFTSIHGLMAWEKNGFSAQDLPCYCINGRTESKAREMGFFIKGSANNSRELADVIADKNEREIIHCCNPSVLPFVGDRIKGLTNYQVIYFYEKHRNDIEFGPKTEMLFFSPSQVKLYNEWHSLQDLKIAFAIGKTTAEMLKSINNIDLQISTIPSEEALIDLAIKYDKQ